MLEAYAFREITCRGWGVREIVEEYRTCELCSSILQEREADEP
jgi:hypothetical protein